MKQEPPIRDSELIVQQARRSFDDIRQFVEGVISALRTEGDITPTTYDCIQTHINRLDTQSKKIESEFYHLRNIIQERHK